jgi:hypothetical protein
MSFAVIARPQLIATPAVEAVEDNTAYEAQRQKEIAATIFAQLGGRRIGAMIKLQHVYAIDNGLQVRFANTAAGQPNMVEIVLDPSDTYNVKFSRIRGLNITTTSEHDGVYCDMLVDLFERKTGLLLSI